jgi:hypothetical protein
LEYSEKQPGLTGLQRATKLSGYVYVCLNCGRRSYDRLGRNALIPGWSRSCTKAAVRLPSKALELNHQGLVRAVQKGAVVALQKVSLS